MKIKMLTTAAGPNFKAFAGYEIEVPLDYAHKLISGGFAVPVGQCDLEEKETMEQEKQEEIETEAVDPAEEKAIKPAPKRKGPKKKPYNRK